MIMPYQIGWHVDKRVIRTHFYGEVTWADISANSADVKKFIQEVSVHPLFYIVDTLDITQYPTQLNDLLILLRQSAIDANDIQWTLLISRSPFINFVGTMVSGLFKTPIRTHSTITEVEKFIIDHAPDLIPAIEARADYQSAIKDSLVW
jgi:hypothetical protein